MADKKSKQVQSLTQAQIRYTLKRIDEIVEAKLELLSVDKYWRDSDYVKRQKYHQYLGQLISSGKKFEFLRGAFVNLINNSGRVDNIDPWDYIKISGAKSFEDFKAEYKDSFEKHEEKKKKLKEVATRLKDKLMLSPSTFVLDELSKLENFEL